MPTIQNIKEHIQNFLALISKKESLQNLLRLINGNSKSEIALQHYYLLLKRGYKAQEIQKLLPAYSFTDSDLKNNTITNRYYFLKTRIDTEQFLYLSLQDYEYRQKNRQNLQKNLSYPLLLLMAAIVVSFFFTGALIPQILGSFTQMMLEVNINGFLLFIKLIQYLMLTTVVLVLVIILLLQNKIIQIQLYVLGFRYFPGFIYYDWVSLQFSHLLLLLYQSGLSIKESLQLMRSLKNQPLIANLAFHLNSFLEMGFTLVQAVEKSRLTAELKAYLNIAVQTNDFESIVSDYVELKKIIIYKRINKYAKVIQTISYLYIGMLLIIMYQVIFMPMQLINQF